jgi:glycosyltransferase involved in cell wall biosynthesis
MKLHFISIGWGEFNLNTVNERALGGIESSACFLMESLNQSKQEIHFWNDVGNEQIIKNIAHHKLPRPEKLSEIQGDIIIYIGSLENLIILRKNIDKKIPILLWIQHSYDQPSLLGLKNKEIINSLDGIVFVSEWQRINCINHFNINNIQTYCLGNGITPHFCNMFSSFEDFKIKKIENLGIYSSAPFRGLKQLYQCSNYISQDIVIDIYSSMKVYNQNEENKDYLQFYEKISKSKNFRYFGSVNKNELAKAHINKSFLTYPSVFAETFCITLLDSLAAGLEPIITDLGALKETSNGFGKLLSINNSFLEDYAKSLDESIKNKKLNFEKWCEKQYKQYLFINKNYTWEKKSKQWLDLVKMVIFKKRFTL